MSALPVSTSFGYSYLPGVVQYSGGVSADDGYQLVRNRLLEPLPLASGFDLARTVIEAAGLPLTSLCATEIRSLEPFSEQGFVDFNTEYNRTLRAWGILSGDDNPVARSNVCPEIKAPTEPSLYAFTYAAPSTEPSPVTFVVSGSGEAPEGGPSYADHVVAPGDTSSEGMVTKARFVIDELTRRLRSLGRSWDDVEVTQMYTVHDPRPAFEAGLMAGSLAQGLLWHYCRPPIDGLDFEMDCHFTSERVIGEHV